MEEFLVYVLHYFIRVLSILCGIIYFRSSIGKLKDIYAFKVVIQDYKIFPKSTVPLITAMIPAVEIGTAVGLFLGGSNIFSVALVGVIMQVCFAILMLIKLNQVQPNGCGCFGLHSAEKITMRHVGRNIAMLTMFFILVVFPETYLI
ncbi:MauE/DoxX family redox-associated membrane protein [Bacillus sp. FSL W7-1360]